MALGGLVKFNTASLDKKVAKENLKRLTLAGLVIEGHAKRACPKVTGHLSRSISTAPSPEDLPAPLPGEVSSGSTPLRLGDKAIFVGTNVFYGIHVEYGTMYFSGRYFMHKGLAMSGPQIRRIFGGVG